MEKKVFFLSSKDLKKDYACNHDLFLDENFILWPAFTPFKETLLKEISTYSIKRLNTKNQPELLTPQEFISFLDEQSVKVEEVGFIKNYRDFFSSIKETLEDFKKTKKISLNKFDKGLTTFLWKMKEEKVSPNFFNEIREEIQKNDYFFQEHFILALIIFTSLFATKYNFSAGDIKDLAYASLICTLGLNLLPLNHHIIFSKEGFSLEDLTESEKRIYYSYPLLSSKVAESTQVSKSIYTAVLQHQELKDKKGFPLKPPSFQISQISQILGISYKILQAFFTKDNLTFYASVILILRKWGVGYPPTLLKEILDFIIPYKPNTIVQLSNGKLAKVIQINEEDPNRPFLTYSIEKKELNEDDRKDIFLLEENSSTSIVKIISPEEINI